jgi:peptidoglycan biosynthesis protein MviN/MurJ (putative lipid II flippase)
VDCDTADRTERLRRILLVGTRLSLASVVPVAGTLMVLARPLLQAWVGKSFDPRELDAAVLVLQVLSLTVIVRVGSATSGTLLKGAGHHRLLAVTNVSTAIVNLILSIALIGRFQLTGVAVGTLVPVSLGGLLILVPAGCARVGISVRRACTEAVWPAIWPCVPMAVWALALRTRLDTSLFAVGIAAATSAGVYVLFFLRFSTMPEERALLVARLRVLWITGARRLQPNGDRGLPPRVNPIPSQGTTPHV